MKFLNLSKILVIFTLCFLCSESFKIKVDSDKNASKRKSWLSRNQKSQVIKNIRTLKRDMIKNHGAELANFSLRFINENNRYFVMSKNVDKDKVLAKIPFMKLYHIKNKKIKDFCQGLKVELFSNDNELYLNQFLCLVAFLANQMKNPEHEFKSYIDSIPKSFREYPLFFTGRDREIVKNSFLENNMIYKENQVKYLFESLKKSQLKDQLTLDDIKSAFIAVNSRNFIVKLKYEDGDYNVLAPYVDLFNFNPEIKTFWSQNLEDDADDFYITSTQKIKKGEQVFVYYGSKDNNHYLNEYGFTFDGNNFPKVNYFFKIQFKGQDFWITLYENITNNLINFAIENRDKNHNNSNVSNDDKINNDIQTYELILENLKKYSNKNRLNDIFQNLNETPNMLNIYRALKDEDILIDKNIDYLSEIIRILKDGKISYNIINQNMKYFKQIFEKNN